VLRVPVSCSLLSTLFSLSLLQTLDKSEYMFYVCCMPVPLPSVACCCGLLSTLYFLFPIPRIVPPLFRGSIRIPRVSLLFSFLNHQSKIFNQKFPYWFLRRSAERMPGKIHLAANCQEMSMKRMLVLITLLFLAIGSLGRPSAVPARALRRLRNSQEHRSNEDPVHTSRSARNTTFARMA
jgi:hypothetical protein